MMISAAPCGDDKGPGPSSSALLTDAGAVPATVVDFVSQSSPKCNLMGQRSAVGVGGSAEASPLASTPVFLFFLLLCWSSLPRETCSGRTALPGSSDTAVHAGGYPTVSSVRGIRAGALGPVSPRSGMSGGTSPLLPSPRQEVRPVRAGGEPGRPCRREWGVEGTLSSPPPPPISPPAGTETALWDGVTKPPRGGSLPVKGRGLLQL